MNLANRQFELVENPDGHAGTTTVMKFTDHPGPFLGTYAGPNTVYGQEIVNTSPTGQIEMLYQALTSEGNLVAGRAELLLIKEANKTATMQLN